MSLVKKQNQSCSQAVRYFLGFACAVGVVCAPGVLAAELTEADFLGGGDVTILTSSRLAQPIMDSPNATTVLDRATIEATGYHNLSDLFRLIPGLYVGQYNGWFHNVSRTFAGAYSPRMQVLIDGRSVYQPSIGGVRWDTLPLAVSDIERIEVVRGSNAASYGANAFTGIINIITRHPEDVLGTRLDIVAGDHAHQEGWFSWAGQGESSSHRITLGHREDGGLTLTHDDERSEILSYRGHFDLPASQMLGLQAGVVVGGRGLGRVGDVDDLPHEQDLDSVYFQADYRMPLADNSELTTKFYFNSLEHHETVPTDLFFPVPTFYNIDVLAQRWHLEGQYSAALSADVRTLVGGYFRRDSVQSAFYYGVPDRIRVDSKGMFGHLEWRLAQEWLLNLGAFWEDYELVGGKTSPRIALNWQPSPNHTVRFGVSKGYRNPVVFETSANMRATIVDANGAVVVVTPPFNVTLGPINPEQLVSREISYLGSWPEQGVTLDLRVFDEHIDDFINFPGGVATNLGPITQRGTEAQFKWQPQSGTQIIANYAYLHIDTQNNENDYSPTHQAGLHLMHTFPKNLDLTLSRYWTSSFRPLGEGVLPSARRWDARIAKRFNVGNSRAQVAIGVLNAGENYQEFRANPRNSFDTRSYVQLKLDI